MTIVQYTHLNNLPSKAQYAALLSTLPIDMKNNISAYTNFSDSALRLAGKLLLIDCIKKIDLADIVLITDLKFNNHGKPLFKPPLACSISYADNMAIVACSTDGAVGIDMELLRPIDINLYRDYFTKKEWQQLQLAANNYITFFDMWTRKEAIVKAIGKGFFKDLNTIEVIDNNIRIDNAIYTLQKLTLNTNYCCHMATSCSSNSIVINSFDVFKSC